MDYRAIVKVDPGKRGGLDQHGRRRRGAFEWPQVASTLPLATPLARERGHRMMDLMDGAFALARLAELMPEARARFGVRELAVFGSVARGDASAASDLDVLVDFAGKATFDGFMGLKLFLEDNLGIRIDLVTRAALKPRLRARIEAEARRVA